MIYYLMAIHQLLGRLDHLNPYQKKKNGFKQPQKYIHTHINDLNDLNDFFFFKKCTINIYVYISIYISSNKLFHESGQPLIIFNSYPVTYW